MISEKKNYPVYGQELIVTLDDGEKKKAIYAEYMNGTLPAFYLTEEKKFIVGDFKWQKLK